MEPAMAQSQALDRGSLRRCFPVRDWCDQLNLRVTAQSENDLDHRGSSTLCSLEFGIDHESRDDSDTGGEFIHGEANHGVVARVVPQCILVIDGEGI